MWLFSLLLLGQSAGCVFSFIFPNASDSKEIKGNYEHYEQSSLVNGVAVLGSRILADLLSSSQSNFIISPINIFSCLDLIKLGSAGLTRDEIVHVLGRPKDEKALNQILENLHGTNYASSLFISRKIIPKAEFIRNVNNQNSEIILMDFDKDPNSTSFINGWVAKKTNGTIREIIQGNVSFDTKLVVVSALVFSGKWLHPFSPLATEWGSFKIDENNYINVPMMHLQSNLPVLKAANYDVIGLDYSHGGLRMYIILPRNHGLQELSKILNSFSALDLTNFYKSAKSTMTFLEIPKFKIDCKVSLKNALMKQGMHTSFDPVRGNFTNIGENKGDVIFISDIYHSVHIEVNEQETIASAASAAIFTKSQPCYFKIDRPFIFVISDKTGIMLFSGAILRPM